MLSPAQTRWNGVAASFFAGMLDYNAAEEQLFDLGCSPLTAMELLHSTPAFEPGDIVRDRSNPAHVARVVCMFDFTCVRVRWAGCRRVADERTTDLEIVVKERTLFARLASQH